MFLISSLLDETLLRVNILMKVLLSGLFSLCMKFYGVSIQFHIDSRTFNPFSPSNANVNLNLYFEPRELTRIV